MKPPPLPTVAAASGADPSNATFHGTVADGADGLPLAGAPELTARYLDLGVLGTGGMAVVHRVQDRLLDRKVAMKVLSARYAADTMGRARFVREARLLAALRHPGIVPVHHLGELSDGRPFFTMDEVRGRSLGEVLREGSLSLPFRIGVLARVCATVAYAHASGVLHRDLKPGNVMLGDRGEVRVVDWGIARASWVGAAAGPGVAPGPGGAGSAGAEPERGTGEGTSGAAAPDEHTRVGAITGTPAYMAPEQAAGDTAAVGPHSDVYALGALLYTLLAGRPPYLGRDWRQVLAGPPPPVWEVAAEGLPGDLVALCERAMARTPADRPTAEVVGEAVDAWLAGAQRVAHARAALEAAAARVPDTEAARTAADRARLEWIARESVHPFDADDATNAALWDDDNAAVALDVRATLLEAEEMRALRGVLAEAPELPEARELLADRLLAALRTAEDYRDPDAARAIAEELREQVAAIAPSRPARSRLEAGLDGRGTLTLTTDPPGAVVRLGRFEEQGRRLVEVPTGTLGSTPLHDVPLAMGSWMLTVSAPGCTDVRLPVVVRREERWARVAPGEVEARTLRLPRAGELGPDDCYVPAGWFVRRRPEGVTWPALRAWTESFVIRRFPVTNREFLPFLDDLWATGRRGEALDHAPRMSTGPLVAYTLEGDHFVIRPDEQGDLWLPDWPVYLVSPRGASAYARWLAARTALGWRLPTVTEWIHAARGADGRRFGMGDHLDAAWAGTHPIPLRDSPVGTYPLDVSPYGVRDLMGGVADYVEDVGPQGSTYAPQGGSSGQPTIRSCLDERRTTVSAELREWLIGIRLVRSAP